MFKYKVTYWSEYASEEKIDQGIVIGTTYVDATSNLMDAFGDDLIDLYLIPLGVENEAVISWEDIQFSFKEEE